MTPKAYLDFLATTASIAASQGAELAAARERLLNGMSRLQVGSPCCGYCTKESSALIAASSAKLTN